MYDSLDRLIIKYVKTGGAVVQSLMNTYDDKGRVSDFDYSISGLGSRKSYSSFYSNGSLSCFRPANPGSYQSADWIGFNYDKFDRTTSRIIGRENDGSIPSFTYNYTYKDLSTTQTTNLVASLGCSISGTTQLQFNYTYDALGNIKTVRDLNNNLLATYNYDSLNQLIYEGLYKLNKSYRYAYDSFGNIYSITERDFKGIGPYTVKTFYYSDSGKRDLLTGGKTTTYTSSGSVYSTDNWSTYTYDSNLNPLTYDNGSDYTFTWQNGRQLASAVKGGVTTSYAYNCDGIRTQKTVGGVTHTYYLNGSQLLAEKWGNCYIEYLYDENGNPLSVYYYNGTTVSQYYFITNLQGDVVQLLDVNKIVVANYNYNAWGKIISVTNASGTVITDTTSFALINPIRYRGYYYDTETGFYYLQSRYYDPENGRFINGDCIINGSQGFDGYNMFAYCCNNPVNTADYDGKCSVLLIKIICKIFNAAISLAKKIAQAEADSIKPIDRIPELPFTQEEKNIIATVAGEAIGENTLTQKAVAHTIMNRVNEPRDSWSDVKCVNDVLTHSQYAAVGGDEYNKAMAYLNNRDGSNALYECLIAAVIPIYYGVEPDNTGGAHFIFNSASENGAALEADLKENPLRYTKCGPFVGISDIEYRMYTCEY